MNMKLKRDILKALANPMSVSALAQSLGMQRNELTGYLKALEDLGLVKSTMIGRAKVYSVTEK